MKKITMICIVSITVIILICMYLFIKTGKTQLLSNTKTNRYQLTIEEKLNDFNYMYDLLKDNFANFKNEKEQYGYDWLSHRNEFENMIAKTKNNNEFYFTINKILNKLKQGHTNFLDSSEFKYYREIYNKYASTDNVKKWADILNNPKAINLYNSSNINFNYTQNTQKNSNTNLDISASFKILKSNSEAYMKIPSMGDELIVKDGTKIYDFFKQIRNYPYLIIDIRGNGGGNDTYWINNIVSPLLEKDISYPVYSFLKGGEYSLNFYKDRYSNIGAKIENISKLSKQVKCPQYIRKDFKYFITYINTITSKNYTGFKGKIFVFIDSNDFSASESFAIFCKTTHWATLVGTNTGGDGIGVDPILAILPNSGLVFRFTAETSFNSDGKSNEQYGTSPDIYVSGSLEDYINAMKKYCK